jgi:Secretion system C-terminal sorting domain
MRRFYALGLFLVLTNLAFSQDTQPVGFKIGPLSTNAVLERFVEPPHAETPPPDSIDLPFMDDFSNIGPYPDPNLWLDRQVFINSTMSGNTAPSIGVASFDAVGANGKPYPNINGSIEAADTLTSNYINLKNFVNTSGTRQNLTAADSVYMTFFLQPKGLCYAPKTLDSMQLEFRTSAGEWRVVRSFKGIADSIVSKNPFDLFPPFTFYAVPITEAAYFYGKFQFRFRNFARTGGIAEVWHLDYVKIAPNRRLSTVKNLDDMAFVEPPRNPLTRYTSMPWRHAKANLAGEFRDSVYTTLFNHFAIARNPTNTNLKISASDGTTPVDNYTLIDGVNVPPSIFYQAAKKEPIAAILLSLGQTAASIVDLTIKTEQSLEIGGQESNDLAKAALRNDKVTRTTDFRNYFAYDDGTAEMEFTAFGDGQLTAIKYKLNVKDTIRGVQFAFPFIKGLAPTPAPFNLKIWKDSLNTTPIFEQNNMIPYYVTTKTDSLQGFTTYRLETKTKKDTFIIVNAGDIFVGWQNVGNVGTPIGLDRNSLDKTQYLYQRISGAWQNITPKIGAVMVRPIIGGGVPLNTSALRIKELALSSVMTIYPNPARDRLFFDLKTGVSENYDISIFNLVGRLEKREILRGPALDISSLATGVYVLKIRDVTTNQLFNHKFVVQK